MEKRKINLYLPGMNCFFGFNMFFRTYILSFVFLFVCFCLPGQTNRALFVAIDRYPEESGWMDIHAVNDYELVLPMLKQSGYEEKNIKVLLNEKAVKKAIVKALKDLSRQAGAGDFIYIHFSCHGQQMIDDDGDEPDGLDEALIPYDANRRYIQGKYEGENHLRDDELDILLKNIREKAGSSGNVTVLLDACHSGTATRHAEDEDYIRGTSYIFAPPGEYFTERTKAPEKELEKNRSLAPLTVFSACSAGEVNYEYKPDEQQKYFGLLTYAFCRLMIQENASLSHAGFSSLLKMEMQQLGMKRKKQQTPFIETTDHENRCRIGR